MLGGRRTECKCGNTTFNNRDEMWCCNNASCSGRGEFETSDNANFWRGEEDKEGRMIGAECSGAALKLEQSCNGTCNDHEQDPGRNWEGVLRSFVPCNVNNLKTTQCIREDKYRDGDVDCKNRADEEIFLTGFEKSSSLLLDLEDILRPCSGGQGFKCSRSNALDEDGGSNCLYLFQWCNPSHTVYTCDELKGKTATGKTTDPQLCGNQTFWERRSCSIGSRCTGETPGQCHFGVHGCLDGSSENRLAKNQTGISAFENQYLAIDCGDDLTCTARDGEWAKKKICVGKKFLCDNYLQCEDGKDEEDCELQYKEKGIFSREHRHICKSPFLNITRGIESGKFFPMRAIRCLSLIIINSSSS